MHPMVINETVVVDDIPIVHFVGAMDAPQPQPTVFLYHGWDSRKEHYAFQAEILSLHGFRVIVPDAALHGDREADRDTKADFWSVILQSVQEFHTLLDFARSTWGVNPRTTAVVGNSMGGFSAAGIFAHYPLIRCLVSMNGSGAWEESESVFRRMDGRPPATDEDLRPIRTFDPLNFLPHLPPRPVLLQHGASDSIVPIDGQRKFYKALQHRYGESGSGLIEFQELPRMDHYVSIGMFEYATEWLKQRLLG